MHFIDNDYKVNCWQIFICGWLFVKVSKFIILVYGIKIHSIVMLESWRHGLHMWGVSPHLDMKFFKRFFWCSQGDVFGANCFVIFNKFSLLSRNIQQVVECHAISKLWRFCIHVVISKWVLQEWGLCLRKSSFPFYVVGLCLFHITMQKHVLGLIFLKPMHNP
jgi:hypothetical protein